MRERRYEARGTMGKMRGGGSGRERSADREGAERGVGSGEMGVGVRGECEWEGSVSGRKGCGGVEQGGEREEKRREGDVPWEGGCCCCCFCCS